MEGASYFAYALAKLGDLRFVCLLLGPVAAKFRLSKT